MSLRPHHAAAGHQRPCWTVGSALVAALLPPLGPRSAVPADLVNPLGAQILTRPEGEATSPDVSEIFQGLLAS
jgi:hypothetical protein